MGTVTLYLRRDFEATWDTFVKVCQREGDSPSQKLEKWVSEYMEVHGDGNPQTLLEYAGEPKTLPLWKTCKYSHGRLQGGSFHCDHPRMGFLKLTPKRCEEMAHKIHGGFDVGCYRMEGE